jgi:hypothetical protein
MSKKCNSNHKNTQDKNYICNPQTGNWVKKDGVVGKKILGKTKKTECSPNHKYAKDKNYICNPKTWNWVKKDGVVGKKLLGGSGGENVGGPKECNPKYKKGENYICNPETGKWVKKDGVVGKKILGHKKKMNSPKHSVKSTSSVPMSLYYYDMFQVKEKVPFLDNKKIKYQIWDNHDNKMGTCVWHVISKALNTPIPEIAKKIKNMSQKVHPNMIMSKEGKTTNSLVYKKLMNYEKEEFGVPFHHFCEFPKFAKEYAIITFPVFKKTYTNVNKIVYMSGIPQCVYPLGKYATKVIFTLWLMNENTGASHLLLIKLQEYDGYSYTISDIQPIFDKINVGCAKKIPQPP